MISQNDLKKANIQLMLAQDTKYHLTIKFPYKTKKENCRRNLSMLIRYLNREIYKGRYKSGTNFIVGFASEEFSEFENTDHYHILIKNCEYLPNYKKFLELIEKKVANIKKIDPKNCVIDPFLQDYYNYGGNFLEKYVTKDFIPASLYSDDTSIGLLSSGDVIF